MALNRLSTTNRKIRADALHSKSVAAFSGDVLIAEKAPTMGTWSLQRVSFSTVAEIAAIAEL